MPSPDIRFLRGYGITSVGGFRSKEGPHGWGLAIDIDGSANPYVLHEARTAGRDELLTPVYDRIAEFILNDPVNGQQSIIPQIITQGGSMTGAAGQSRAGRLGEHSNWLTEESEAMQVYFGLMNNPDPNAIADFLKGPWLGAIRQAHHRPPMTCARKCRRTLSRWAARLRQSPHRAGPRPCHRSTGHKGKPSRRSESSPPQGRAAGFLTIPREVVLGLGLAVTRWRDLLRPREWRYHAL